MERSELIDMMVTLKLAGMRATFDEVLAKAQRRRHGIEQVLGELLKAEIAEKQARSVRYQFGAAKLPLAKDLSDFTFTDTPINEALVRDLATGAFLAQQRNVVLIGGTGTGKSQVSIAVRG
jgi:DNA replication protein DnaC